MVENRTTGVGSKVAGSIRHTLNLHVVGVEAVLSSSMVCSFNTRFTFVTTSIYKAHLRINVEVRLHLPLNVLRDVAGEGRFIDRSNGSIVTVLSILTTLLHEVRGGLDTIVATFCGSALIGTCIVALYRISDVEVCLNLGDLIVNRGVVVRNVCKRRGIMGIGVVSGSLSISIIDSNCLTVNFVFMVAYLFISFRIPLVLLNHRAVVLGQCSSVDSFSRFTKVNIHRHTHDFPSVLVEKDDLRFE